MTDLTIKISRSLSNEYSKYLAGWHVLYPYMMSLPVDQDALNKLRILLSIEVARDQCRAFIVQRLVGRIRAIRHILEEQSLYAKIGPRYKPIKTRQRKVKRKAKKKIEAMPSPPESKTTAEILLESGA